MNSTSHVHSGAAPLLQTNNPVEISAGIGGSVLDHLLPPTDNVKSTNSGLMNMGSWNNLAKKATEDGIFGNFQENASNAFEQFKRQAREKEEKVILMIILTNIVKFFFSEKN